jgi:hypothetical protein
MFPDPAVERFALGRIAGQMDLLRETHCGLLVQERHERIVIRSIVEVNSGSCHHSYPHQHARHLRGIA